MLVSCWPELKEAKNIKHKRRKQIKKVSFDVSSALLPSLRRQQSHVDNTHHPAPSRSPISPKALFFLSLLMLDDLLPTSAVLYRRPIAWLRLAPSLPASLRPRSPPFDFGQHEATRSRHLARRILFSSSHIRSPNDELSSFERCKGGRRSGELGWIEGSKIFSSGEVFIQAVGISRRQCEEV